MSLGGIARIATLAFKRPIQKSTVHQKLLAMARRDDECPGESA
jgi:hypothetical protein